MNRRRYFDNLARDWDKTHHQDTQDRLRQLINSLEINRGEWVIDLGCGTGILFLHIFEKIGGEGKILGIDYSVEMLKEAKKKWLGPMGSAPMANILLSAGDARFLPVKEKSFEVITCFASFAHFQDKEGSLLEMQRLLKPGGRIYIFHLLGRDQLAEHHGHAGEPLRGDILPENEEMKRMLQEAGFRNIEVMDRPSLYLARAKKPGKHQ